MGTSLKRWRLMAILLLMLAVGILDLPAVFAIAEPIDFVYIHGTNRNTPDSQQFFNESVAKLHPYIKSSLEKEPLFQAHALEHGQYEISPKTINFFWGDASQVAIESLRRSVYSSPLIHGWLHLAERARAKLDFTLHDAVWLEKESSKKEVLHNLFDALMNKNRHPVVLMGHSAGSLLTYNLLIYRLPYLDIQDFGRELHADPKVLDKIKDQGHVTTCLLSAHAQHHLQPGQFVLLEIREQAR